MGARQIKFDFELAMSQAKQLENISHEIERNITCSLKNSQQELTAAWKGNSAKAYLRKEERLKSDIAKTGTTLGSIAEEIKVIARKVYQAEQHAITIASTR